MSGAPTATAVRTRIGGGIRPEIQALRALAVFAVVIGHVWPRVAPAGFLGVDVFFVISGFLITGQLMRERERTGRLDLLRFYLRRARRLLPAAVTALAATTLATLVVVPRDLWRQYLGEILSSLFYVQNWFLAIASADADRAALDGSPVVHFWSLSVEEQFYFVWPLVVMIGFIAAARMGERRGMLVVLSTVTVASFGYSVLQTGVNSDFAYYSTLSRAWEFGIGGLLALLPRTAGGLSDRQRAVLSWLGIVLIVGSVVAWTDKGAFPGWTAIVPVLGAAAVIHAGAPDAKWGPLPLARTRLVQWFGDASYSLYLWHWPIIALLPFATGVPTPWYVLVPLLGLCVAVSALSLRFIENPMRRTAIGDPSGRGLVVGYTALGLGTAAACTAGLVLA
ncbi:MULTISPECIES: acyltransferase [Bacteria]|uniref:acyltransferase family protein n=1 Tax=Bacteria TaxID=2 RepID=UPI0025DF017A|nr:MULTISPECIES: acyltransferase [Bacteria]